ncbi:hypothetical protein [Thalassospira sp.]|uniref:hypothetical protein n=1 Tax=Thalassospira sp. TaxID=1912094 RepID=UPI001B190D09|nr:hypothetical protein [Thalassospira sp.]MBO6809242.1 hypothetical protein [Thalassospira sp.]MBO6841201.1 hypothetical protein [Thalassospira sp.]
MNENTAQDASITNNATTISVVSATTGDIATCGDAGRLYGPGHTQASGDCIPTLTLDANGNVQVSGGFKVGNATTCDSPAEGTIRYNSSTKEVEYCDGTAWKAFGTGGGCDYNYLGVTNADLDTYYTSNTPALSGFSGTQTATVDGDTTVTIVKNGSDTGLQSTNVSNGDTVGFRVKSPSLYSRALNLTMDIGTGFTSCWQVATKDQDATPDAFAFNDLPNENVNTLVESNAVALSEFDGPIAITVSGDGNPEIRINGGAWASAGEANPGDMVRIRLMTSGSMGVTYQANYQIGTVAGVWSVTTDLIEQISDSWQYERDTLSKVGDNCGSGGAGERYQGNCYYTGQRRFVTSDGTVVGEVETSSEMSRWVSCKCISFIHGSPKKCCPSSTDYDSNPTMIEDWINQMGWTREAGY